MKSELRHELKSNLLADRLEEAVLRIKPYLKLIGFIAAALIAAVIIYGLVQTRNESVSGVRLVPALFLCQSTGTTGGSIRRFPSTLAGLWAKQKSADSLLARGLEQIYVDRDLADKLLGEAEQAYRAVLAKASEPTLVCRATMGLAQVLDSQANSEEAAREYRKILGLPGAHAELIADVQRRLEFIESEKGKDFFAWFKTNRPTAPKPVDIPGNLNQLPSQPDLKFDTPSPSAPANTTPQETPPASPPAANNFEMRLKSPSRTKRQVRLIRRRKPHPRLLPRLVRKPSRSQRPNRRSRPKTRALPLKTRLVTKMPPRLRLSRLRSLIPKPNRIANDHWFAWNPHVFN